MNPFRYRYFQDVIILWAVRWHCKYGISYRELQEMLLGEVFTSITPQFTAVFNTMSRK